MRILVAERFCTACGGKSKTQKFACAHPIHAAATVASFGYWLPIWLSLWAVSVALPYRCVRCRGRCGSGGNSIPHLIGAAVAAFVLLIVSLLVIDVLRPNRNVPIEIDDRLPQLVPNSSTIAGTETAEVPIKHDPIVPPPAIVGPVAGTLMNDPPFPPKLIEPLPIVPGPAKIGPFARTPMNDDPPLPPAPKPIPDVPAPFEQPGLPRPPGPGRGPVEPVPPIPVNPSPKWIANATISGTKARPATIAKPGYLDAYREAFERGDTKATKKLIADGDVVLVTTTLPVHVENRFGKNYANIRPTEGDYEGLLFMAWDIDAVAGVPGVVKK